MEDVAKFIDENKLDKKLKEAIEKNLLVSILCIKY